MKINHWITIITLFICHFSIAQSDSLEISPFDSYLTKVKNNDTSILVEFKDSLVLWKQIEKIDSTKKWKLIGLKICDSTRYATEENFPLTSDRNIFFRARDILPTINSDTLNNQFKLDKVGFLKTTDWNQYDLSIDWTPFRYNNLLIIKKCLNFYLIFIIIGHLLY